MKWIGLTGNIATGKSSAARILRTLGWEVVDADSIVHELLLPNGLGLKQMKEHWPDLPLNADLSLDRKAWGARVFSNKDLRDQVEKVLHPLVRNRVRMLKDEFEGKSLRAAIYDVPLLFEKHLEKDFDGVLLIACSEENQLRRLVQRDQLSKGEALARIQAQIPQNEKRLSATWIIDNDSDEEYFKKKVIQWSADFLKGMPLKN
jgi:dephospho-CoA kinase